MKQKNVLFGLLVVLMTAILSIGLTSCDDDDDDDNNVGLSETQIRHYLESDGGTWRVTQVGDDDSFYMSFRDGYTNGFEGGRFWAPYAVKGDLVYIKSEEGENVSDVLEGGIRLTKLTATKIEFYWANDRSEKYTGTKTEDK